MLAIRGISDIVGLKRDDAWKVYAARSAAAFARAYLRTTPIPPSSDVRPGSSPDGAPHSEAVHEALSPTPAVPDAFFKTCVVPRSTGHNRVPRCAWLLEITPRSETDRSRAELHDALVNSMVVEDMQNFGRTARWPRLLRLPEAIQETHVDGRQVWRHEYETARNNVGEEFLSLDPRARVVFRRDSLWDVEHLAIDLDQLAHDLAVVVLLGENLLTRVGLTDGFELSVKVRTSQPAPGTIAHLNRLTAEQPHRTAVLRKREIAKVTRFAPDALRERAGLLDALKRAIDRTANEFDLEPSALRNDGPPFLSITRASVERLVAGFPFP